MQIVQSSRKDELIQSTADSLHINHIFSLFLKHFYTLFNFNIVNQNISGNQNDYGWFIPETVELFYCIKQVVRKY